MATDLMRRVAKGSAASGQNQITQGDKGTIHPLTVQAWYAAHRKGLEHPAYAAMWAAAESIDVVRHYYADLDIDRHFVTQEPASTPFLWTIGECGTHEMYLRPPCWWKGQIPTDSQHCQSTVDCIIRLYPREHWYHWDGEHLAAISAARAHDLAVEADRARNEAARKR
jgi:hypothetical protein